MAGYFFTPVYGYGDLIENGPQYSFADKENAFPSGLTLMILGFVVALVTLGIEHCSRR